jgi:predicted nucleic acid-binding protein
VRSGLLDTSVVLEWDDPAVIAALPDEAAISAVTLAELSAGPQLARDPAERARRQARVQQVESLFDPLPFDAAAARSYGEIAAALTGGRRASTRRPSGLMIAATARAHRLLLYTRRAGDYAGLEAVVTVVAV